MKTKKSYKILYETSATVSMLRKLTGFGLMEIKRSLKELEKADLLWVVEENTCPVSGEVEQFYTSNPSKAGRCLHQLKLWEATP